MARHDVDVLFVQCNVSCGITIIIGIITVPAEYAQSVADLMVAWGVKAIWNFTPARIRVPEDIVVQNTSLYANLAIIFNKIYTDKAKMI